MVRPGSIGAIAYVFARYANRLWPLGSGKAEYLGWVAYAAGSILVLDRRQSCRRMGGKMDAEPAQHGQGPGPDGGCRHWALALRPASPLPPAEVGSQPNLGLALILVLFVYGGWSEMAYVAAKVRGPNKNILRAMFAGHGGRGRHLCRCHVRFSPLPGV